MHRWLMTNPVFGDYLKNIEEKKGMPLKAKILTLIVLWTSLAFSIHAIGPLMLKAMLVVIGVGVSAWILRMTTLRNDMK